MVSGVVRVVANGLGNLEGEEDEEEEVGKLSVNVAVPGGALDFD